jgi:two-component system response regulator AtoC
MVGGFPAFLTLLGQLRTAARSNLPVLLLGETGTGKELAAQFLHQQSDRKSGPLQTVDCTVLNEALVESELFGHEKGAFTGHSGTRKGLFEVADGGTLFLDEIGDLPAAMQPKLLRVLESGEFRRVGAHQTRRTDVRVICATNRHLWKDVENGSFREDLYYRIACLSVHVPALR